MKICLDCRQADDATWHSPKERNCLLIIVPHRWTGEIIVSAWRLRRPLRYWELPLHGVKYWLGVITISRFYGSIDREKLEVIPMSWKCGESSAGPSSCECQWLLFPAMRREEVFRGISIEIKGLNLFPNLFFLYTVRKQLFFLLCHLSLALSCIWLVLTSVIIKFSVSHGTTGIVPFYQVKLESQSKTWKSYVGTLVCDVRT